MSDADDKEQEEFERFVESYRSAQERFDNNLKKGAIVFIIVMTICAAIDLYAIFS